MQSQSFAIRLDSVTQRYRVISERPDTVRELFARFLRHKTSFHDFDALKDVSFTVQRGEVVGIIGRNGSGKSTTLKIIAGVYRPTAGKVLVNGTVAPLIELGAGFHSELTGRENILLNGLLMGYSKREMIERQEKIIQFAGIGDFIDAPVKQYSSGMYLRLAFAVATEVDPDILVVDEILSVGDLGFQKQCYDRLKHFRDMGKTILLVTHSMADVLSHCDRAIYLEKGQMLFDGPADEAVALYRANSLRHEPMAIQGVEPVTVSVRSRASTAIAGGGQRETSATAAAATMVLEEQPTALDLPSSPALDERETAPPPQPPAQQPLRRDFIQKIDSAFRALAGRLSNSEFIEFDTWAIWFYAICLALFLLASLADLNGSSIDIFNQVLHHGAAAPPLVGSPRPIRMDEWAFHTPSILNESLRAHRFEVESSPLGNHSVALLGNLPVAHVSTLFRPQFWSFFVLPVDYAFAVYWQFKALLLITGVFTWLLLLTRSTWWSITGALWYFFSAFIQWSYSWPSSLPEMVGLICLVMVCASYLTIGRNPRALALAALAGAACAINFALCAYVPQLLPLAWLALFFFAAWCIAKREVIFSAGHRRSRILWAAAGVALVAAIGIVVYSDVRVAIAAIANTTYPGKRVFTPPTMWPHFYVAHFLNWSLSDVRVLPRMPNISEASGFLWLAPVTLFCIGQMGLSKLQKTVFAASWCFSALMLAWLLLPIPPAIGRLLGLTLTGGSRPMPALGLANIAIVMLCVASMAKRPVGQRTGKFTLIGRAIGIFALVFTILLLTDYILNLFFSTREVLFSAAFTTILILLILERSKLLLAFALVVPLAFTFGGVNPVERGTKVLTSSELFDFVHRDKDLLDSEWIVFTNNDDTHAPEFLTGVGSQVYNALRYMPDVDHFPLFRSKGYDMALLNTDAYLVVHPLDANAKASLQPAGFGVVRWNVSPSDPVLKQLGIKYAAFTERPSPAVVAGLVPVNKGPVDNFWLYRIP